MSDLISRQAAIDTAMNDSLIINAMDSVKDGDIHRTKRAITRLLAGLPSIDAVPVRHGTWTRVGDNSYKCSECGEVSCCFAHYCPDCGARMWERA